MEEDIVMHVETQGRGPPLVLLHGWGLHGGVWRDLAPWLARRFRVLTPDLPGHGRSRSMPDPYSLATLVEALRRLADGPAVWIGWSLGAMLALALAHAYPGAVVRLALIGATPRFVSAPDWPHAMTAATLAQFAQDLERDYQATLLQFLSLQAGAGAPGRESVRALRSVAGEREAPVPGALRAGLDLLANTDLRARR